MSFSIENNYSALNNYNYGGKSFLLSSLDWLSTPCRRILGGRNVCVLSQTYENEMSTAGKVATLFFSIVIFPLGIVSITSLAIKVATLPWIWEAKKVKVQSQETWNVINQFNRAIEKNEYDQAIQICQRSEIGKRNDIYTNLFKSINQKIINNSSWEEIQKVLPLLRLNDAIGLINLSIKMRLSNEFANDCNLTTPKQINDFIRSSLKNCSIQDLENCYNKLFSDALSVDVNENIILCAIKMDIADFMIKSFIQLKISYAKNDLERSLAKLKENVLRYSLFKAEQKSSYNYSLIFNSTEYMPQVSSAIQDLRNINLFVRQTLNKLNALSTDTNEQEKWKGVRSEFIKFKDNFDQFNISLDQDEKNYIQSLQLVFNDMIEFIDSILKASSIEEIESITKKIELSSQEHIKNISHLMANTKTSIFQTGIDSVLSTLRLKKKGELMAPTEKMKSYLMTMVHATMEAVQKQNQ